jgi:hypothetical protein
MRTCGETPETMTPSRSEGWLSTMSDCHGGGFATATVHVGFGTRQIPRPRKGRVAAGRQGASKRRLRSGAAAKTLKCAGAPLRGRSDWLDSALQAVRQAAGPAQGHQQRPATRKRLLPVSPAHRLDRRSPAVARVQVLPKAPCRRLWSTPDRRIGMRRPGMGSQGYAGGDRSMPCWRGPLRRSRTKRRSPGPTGSGA